MVNSLYYFSSILSADTSQVTSRIVLERNTDVQAQAFFYVNGSLISNPSVELTVSDNEVTGLTWTHSFKNGDIVEIVKNIPPFQPYRLSRLARVSENEEAIYYTIANARLFAEELSRLHQVDYNLSSDFLSRIRRNIEGRDIIIGNLFPEDVTHDRMNSFYRFNSQVLLSFVDVSLQIGSFVTSLSGVNSLYESPKYLIISNETDSAIILEKGMDAVNPASFTHFVNFLNFKVFFCQESVKGDIEINKGKNTSVYFSDLETSSNYPNVFKDLINITGTIKETTYSEREMTGILKVPNTSLPLRRLTNKLVMNEEVVTGDVGNRVTTFRKSSPDTLKYNIQIGESLSKKVIEIYQIEKPTTQIDFFNLGSAVKKIPFNEEIPLKINLPASDNKINILSVPFNGSDIVNNFPFILSSYLSGMPNNQFSTFNLIFFEEADRSWVRNFSRVKEKLSDPTNWKANMEVYENGNVEASNFELTYDTSTHLFSRAGTGFFRIPSIVQVNQDGTDLSSLINKQSFLERFEETKNLTDAQVNSIFGGLPTTPRLFLWSPQALTFPSSDFYFNISSEVRDGSSLFDRDDLFKPLSFFAIYLRFNKADLNNGRIVAEEVYNSFRDVTLVRDAEIGDTNLEVLISNRIDVRTATLFINGVTFNYRKDRGDILVLGEDEVFNHNQALSLLPDTFEVKGFIGFKQ